MRKVLARDVLNLTADEIWELPEDTFILVFDDGEIKSTTRALIYSWYYWAVQRTYPNSPLYTRHHIGDNTMAPKVHLNLLSAIVFDTYFETGETVAIEDLSRMIYKITNDVYNDFSYRLESYVTSLSILDYVDIMEHPVVEQANLDARPNEISINNTYEVIKDMLYNSDELPENNVKRFCGSDLVSSGQMLQSVGPRGYVTDIDSRIFKDPIMPGYVEGFKRLQDAMVESRSGAKALMFAKDPLAEVEYFNRRMQLSTSILCNLHMGDCGSTSYVQFQVRKGDLNGLAGKHYVENGKLQVITKHSNELYGKTINLRSPLTCVHTDPYGICSTCMGQLALAVPERTNIGHVAATELCAKMSQTVLSVKHLDGSSAVTEFIIPDYDKRYISNGKLDGALYVNPSTKFNNLKLVIPSEDAKHIGDITHVSKLSELAITRVSAIRHLGFQTTVKSIPVTDIVPVCTGSNLSSLSTELLSFMRDKGYGLNERGDYVVDLTDWDKELPIIVIPMKHQSMLEFMNNVGAMIESSTKDKAAKRARKLKTLTDYDCINVALMDLFDLVSSKISVNIAHLEIILKTTMIRSSVNKDHRLPLPGMPVEFGSFKDNTELRSLAVQMAYQEQSRTMFKPESYTVTNRPESTMDAILKG